jgi:hypothetical protein
MSGSTSTLDLIASAQEKKEVTANALFDAGSPAVLYGRRASTTTALTWGYYGGMLNISGTPTAVANGTLVLTASTTNYVVALRSTGVVSVSTATTNWNNVAVYMRLYAIVTGASTVTSYTDHRAFLIHDLDFALGVTAGNATQVDQAVTATTRATTTTLGTSLNHELSNTAADITAFHGVAGVTNHCRATGAGKIVNSAGLIVTQGLADITTAAGDTFDVEMLTATTCRIKNYVPAVKTLTPYSCIRLNTANGYGSTNTKIRRFTTTVLSQGSDITYADSAANGGSFTINTKGVYAISYSDVFSATGYYGVSVNSSQLTTTIQSITASDIATLDVVQNANTGGSCSVTLPLNAGDVIRAHTEGTSTGAGFIPLFTIVRIA